MDEKIPKSVLNMIQDYGFGKWKRNSAEKLLRIVHVSAYLTGLFSRQGQKLFWMTDHDSIAPNDSKHMDMMNLFCNVLRSYTKNSFETVCGAVPFENRHLDTLDLLSSTDIVAGAVEHYLTGLDKNDGFEGKGKVRDIFKWLAHDGIALKKIVMVVRPKGGGVVESHLSFNSDEFSRNTTIIPVVM